jgi:hypothetical protein
VNRLTIFLALLTGCATPAPAPGCIPDVCSLEDGRFCEPCDGFNPETAARVCPAGRKHVKLCCDGDGCHRLDREPECTVVIAACQNWVGVNTFDAAGEWLREGTCYEQAEAQP